MAKQHRYTEEDLAKMGLVKLSDGSYSARHQGKTSPYIESQKGNLVIREKVIETTNFTAKINTEWFIKGASVPSKKNSRQNFVKNGKQLSIPSKKHAEYVKLTAMQYQIFGIEFRRAVKHYELKYPLHIQFTFIRGTKQRFDYSNVSQTCEDLMVSNQWIEDDSADHLIPHFATYQYDKQNPGVVIKILLERTA